MSKIKPWLFILTPLIITLGLWVGAKMESLVTPSWTLAVNQISALFALVVFTLVLFISTRISLLEKIFGAYDEIYYSHKFLGIGAFLLSFIHLIFLLIPILQAQGNIGEIFGFIFDFNEIETLLGTISFFGILLLLTLTYISSLPYSLWKKTHEWMGFFFVIGGLHSILIDSDTTTYAPLQIWSLFLVLVGTGSFLYIRFLWKLFPNKYDYQVAKVVNHAEVTDIYLTGKGEKMLFSPGQFVFLSFFDNPNFSKEAHPYTISSSPDDEYVRISIKKLGDYTNKIDTVKIGDSARINGPYGTFFEKAIVKNKPLTFVGSGIGITPFLSFLRAKDKDYNKNPVDLFYLAKDSQDSIYQDEIKNYNKPNFNFFNFKSRELGRHCTPLDLANVYKENLKDRIFFICGSRAVMDSFIDGLLALGVKKRNIVVEDFSFKR